MIGPDLIDLAPMRAGYGQVWQGSELNALFDRVPQPRMVVSLIGETEPFVPNSLTCFLRDNDADTLSDVFLLAFAEAAIAFLARGHNLLIHCFQGKYRSTYLDVAVHMRLGMLFEDAFGLIRRRHPIASLRLGTQRQLIRMEPVFLDPTRPQP